MGRPHLQGQAQHDSFGSVEVAGKSFQRTFRTVKSAESFRATLLVGIRNAEPFDLDTGLPAQAAQASTSPSWFEHACAFVDTKWAHASPQHRRGLADGLVTATCAALPAGGPDKSASPSTRPLGLQYRRERSQGTAASPPDEFSGSLAWACVDHPPLRKSPSPRGCAPFWMRSRLVSMVPRRRPALSHETFGALQRVRIWRRGRCPSREPDGQGEVEAAAHRPT